MKIFTYKNTGDFSKHKVVDVDAEQAQSLIEANAAVKLDLPKLSELEQKADDLYYSHEKAVEDVKESPNPLLQQADVQKYELDKLQAEFEEQSNAVQAEYSEWRAAEIEKAKVRAAQATVNFTKKDEQTAAQFKTRAALKLTMATGEEEKSVALHEIAKEIDLLTDAQKVALQGYLPEVLASVEGEPVQKRKIVEAAQDIRNDDLLALKVAEQLPYDILHKKRQKEIAKKVVAEPTTAFEGGQVNRAFYEEHLKG